MARLPPGPSQSPIRQLARWLRDPLTLLDECAHEIGDAFTLNLWRLGPMTVVFSAPEVVREVLLGSPDDFFAGEASAILSPFVGESSVFVLDGARHAAQRRLIAPPFNAERMAFYFDVMSGVARRAIDSWPRDRQFSLHASMKEITLEVIVRALFGPDGAEDLRALREKGKAIIETAANPIFLLSELRVDLGRFSPWGHVLRLLREVDASLYEQIDRRRAGGTEGRHDVLSVLTDARDEAGEPMSREELRDELITLLIGGNDTTATALAWAFAEVLGREELVRRLRAELTRVTAGGPLRAEHLGDLVLLDATVKETLRLHPVALNTVRVLKRPMRVGGWELPAGAEIAPCIYLTQRRPELYPDPERFDPDRFIGKKIDPYEYFPFGGGARRCLGVHFAQYELKVVLAEVLARATLEPRAKGPLRAVRRAITMAPAGGVPVALRAHA